MKIYIDNSQFEYEFTLLLNAFQLDHKVKIEVYKNKPEINEQDYCQISQSSLGKNCLDSKISLGGKVFTLQEDIRSYEKNSKNAYKRLLYKSLEFIGKENLSWGILTGIRPTKLYNEYSKRFENPIEASQAFSQDFLLSKEKVELLSKIEIVQKEKLKSIQQEDYSIYISVPFCPSKCNYCTFYSNDINKKAHLTKSYIEALKIELELVLKSSWAKNKKLVSLYFGGGTPSALKLDDLDFLLSTVHSVLNFKEIPEITFEAGRPDTLDRDKLELIKSYHINRISINPQTMVNSTLKLIGRNHSAEDIIRGYKLARSVGFDNINMDIILGLEQEDLSSLTYTLDQLFKLDPDSITVHSLALKKTSDLSKMIRQEDIARSNQVVASMTDYLHNQMEGHSYFPYYLYRQKNTLGGQENVGFSKKQKESLYNIFIIEEYQNILAFGPGAVTRYIYPEENRIERISNTKSLEEYIRNVDKYANKKLEMQK